MKYTTTQLVDLDNLLAKHDFEFLKTEGLLDAGDVEGHIHGAINEQKIINKYHAMKYLSENDPSLCESLVLAENVDFELEDLSSETLATLHYQNELQNRLHGFLQEYDELIATFK